MIVIEQESMDYLRFLLYLGNRKRISYLRDNGMEQDNKLAQHWMGIHPNTERISVELSIDFRNRSVLVGSMTLL